MEEIREYCPFCNLIVAPFDPERREVEGIICHSSCYNRKVIRRRCEKCGVKMLIIRTDGQTETKCPKCGKTIIFKRR